MSPTRLTQTLALSAVLMIGTGSAVAQSIETGTIGEANAFETGTLNLSNGGLDPSLWNGTSAARATALLSDLPTDSDDPTVRALIRTAVLSAGTPPSSDNPDTSDLFRQVRFDTILSLGDLQSAQSLAARTSGGSADLALKADMALLAGDNASACETADLITEGRAEPNWAKLRAFCHILQDELPAAEITADLLRDTGYEDPAFFDLFGYMTGSGQAPTFKTLSHDPLYTAMIAKAALPWPDDKAPFAFAARTAMNAVASPQDRLDAIFSAGHALSDAQIEDVLTALAEPGEKSATEPDYTAADITEDPAPQRMGRLFLLAKYGTGTAQVEALTELLREAENTGAFERFVTLTDVQLLTTGPELQAEQDLPLYVRAAVIRNDLPTLQRFHGLLTESPAKQERLALTADALANGFMGGALGTDIETRLTGDTATQARAIRDSYIALALGARLSDVAADVIAATPAEHATALPAGELLALDSAARAGSRAETALRAARLLDQSPINNTDLYRILTALRTAGLNDFAGQVAARDFQAGL